MRWISAFGSRSATTDGGLGALRALEPLTRLRAVELVVACDVDNPLTGVGLRAFPDFRDAYADFSLLGSSDISFGSSFERVALESPHSLYLLVASEQGLVALLVFVTVLVGQTMLGWDNDLVDRARDERHERSGKPIGAGLLEPGLRGV